MILSLLCIGLGLGFFLCLGFCFFLHLGNHFFLRLHIICSSGKGLCFDELWASFLATEAHSRLVSEYKDSVVRRTRTNTVQVGEKTTARCCSCAQSVNK
jgi:hypothetical protein